MQGSCKANEGVIFVVKDFVRECMTCFCSSCVRGFSSEALRSSPNICPRILPRIATPFTHRSGLCSKHSSPAFSHLTQGMLLESHRIVRLRHVQHAVDILQKGLAGEERNQDNRKHTPVRFEF